MSVPVWLLDVDGVINACTRKPDPNVWPADQWLEQKVMGFRILVAQPVLDFIRKVHEDNRAEIRWHTTWQKDAAKLEEAFGMPSLPVQDCPEFDDRHAKYDWFKLPAAERVVMQEGRALVWTDDDLTWEMRGKSAQAFNLMRQAQRILTISPSEQTGLTPKHLRQIDEFLRPDPLAVCEWCSQPTADPTALCPNPSCQALTSERDQVLAGLVAAELTYDEIAAEKRREDV